MYSIHVFLPVKALILLALCLGSSLLLLLLLYDCVGVAVIKTLWWAGLDRPLKATPLETQPENVHNNTIIINRYMYKYM